VDGLCAGFNIGLSAVVAFARDEVKMRVIGDCVSGKKKICLAISDAFAGSDVANTHAVAVKDENGDWLITGTKKWITNGTFADYFVTAARTGPGPKDLSLFLVERGPGLQTKIIKTAYSTAAGTAFIMYNKVKVPKEHLIGKENDGFKCIMWNFNHERWMISVMTSQSRAGLSTSASHLQNCAKSSGSR